MTEPKRHLEGQPGRTACSGHRGRLVTANRAEVTCNVCLYGLLASGEIDDSDPRVTDNMRKHLAERRSRA